MKLLVCCKSCPRISGTQSTSAQRALHKLAILLCSTENSKRTIDGFYFSYAPFAVSYSSLGRLASFPHGCQLLWLMIWMPFLHLTLNTLKNKVKVSFWIANWNLEAQVLSPEEGLKLKQKFSKVDASELFPLSWFAKSFIVSNSSFKRSRRSLSYNTGTVHEFCKLKKMGRKTLS